MKNKDTVIVVGGSLAGLLCANILFRNGWNVRVYERSSGLDGRGAGIATHDELFKAMRLAGAKVDEMLGIQIKGRSVFGKDGEEICHYSYPQILTSWSLLYKRLLNIFPEKLYIKGKDVVDVRDDPVKPEIFFSDGSSDSADLIVGCDGYWSSIRSKCAPEAIPKYAGYVAWRGLIPENMVTQSFAKEFGPLHAFYLGDSHQFVHFAVAGSDDSIDIGARRFSFLWYVPFTNDELKDLLTGSDGVVYSNGIPPSKIQLKHIDKLKNDAKEILPQIFSNTVCKTDQPFVQPIYDLLSPRIAFQRVVLAGDAAFIARPHVGAGVAKAGGDAMELANCLEQSSNYIEALQNYQARRSVFGNSIVKLGAKLGEYLTEPEIDTTRARQLSPERLIRSVAMPMHLIDEDELFDIFNI